MYVILAKFLKIIMGGYSVRGLDNITDSGSSVFVCNHAGAYGPLAMWLFFPLRFRPWVIYRVMTAGLCRRQLEKDLFGNCHAFLKPLCTIAAFFIQPACLWIMRKIKAIPVYRRKGEIFTTFRLSVDTLWEGCNIAIFPENDETLYQRDLKNFYTGFVHLARKYYGEKGRILSFYPVYIDKRRKSITVGKPEAYNPEAAFKNERGRIADTIMEAIRQCADDREAILK